MEKDLWKSRLTAFDAELCKMVETLMETDCEPKNGGNHFFIAVDYSKHTDPDYISATMDAIAGRLGSRQISVQDHPEIKQFTVQIRFYGECKDAAFIPKIVVKENE